MKGNALDRLGVSAQPFRLMQDTTTQLRSEVMGLAGRHTAIFLFGSPHRAEMLPQSDIDFMVPADGTDEGAEERLTVVQKLAELPYDKLDTPQHIHTVNDILATYRIGSPETNIADCTFVDGAEALYQQWAQSDVDSFFVSPDFIVRKQTFQHYFFDYWSRKKERPYGTNIKYSVGGARDLILLDQYHDLTSKGRGRDEARNNTIPQIATYIDDRFTHDPERKQAVAQEIGLILAVKHSTLNTDYGRDVHERGVLSLSSAEKLFSQNPDLVSYAESPAGLLQGFRRARELVRGLREIEYHNMIDSYAFDDPILADLHNSIYDTTDAEELMLLEPEIVSAKNEILDIVYMAKSALVGTGLPSDKVVERVMESGSWFSVASLATHDRLPSQTLHALTVHYSRMPGFEYLNRLLIKHPMLSISSAEFMLASDTLAVDTDINARYKQELSKRYERLTNTQAPTARR